MRFPVSCPIHIVMIGCGGTGGHITPHLYRLLYSVFRPSTLLDACPYSGYFRVVTQPHHEYGYGLSVWIAVEAFTDWEPLLFALLDIMGFFRSSVEVLMVSGEIGKVVPFSSETKQTKEAA